MIETETRQDRRRKFLRAMSHDFREPINTLLFYLEEVDDHHVVKANKDYRKKSQRIVKGLNSLETRFKNFYEAFKKSQNTLKFKNELDGTILKNIEIISRRWAELYEDISYIRFEDEHIDEMYISDVVEIIDGLLQRHSALMKYLDADGTPERVFVDLRQQVSFVIRDLAALLDRESVDRDQIYVHGSCYDRFDKSLIVLVFQNLLSNSIKYSVADRELSIRIGLFKARGFDIASVFPKQAQSLRLQEKGTFDFIVYQDNARGIPPEALQRIFDPYFQLARDKERRDGGAGMGLAIVDNVVDIHGGAITVDSREGSGTRFLIAIPSLGIGSAEASEPSLRNFRKQAGELI